MCLARSSRLPALVLLTAALALAGCPSSTPVTPASKTGDDAGKGTTAKDNQKQAAAGPKAPVTVTTGKWELGLDGESRLVSVSLESDADKDERAEAKKLEVFPSVKSGSAGDAAITLTANDWTVTFNPAGHLVAVALGPSGSDADLEALAGIKTLERLTADKRGVTDKGLESIAKLPALKTLDLSQSDVKDAGISHLKTAPKLEDITLKLCSVTEEGYKSLAAIKTLKRVRAPQTQFNDKCLEAISGMSQLELLDLQDCNRVSEQGWKGLENFKKLKSLRVWGDTFSDTAIRHVPAENLQFLSIDKTLVGPDGLAHIQNSVKITELSFSGCNKIDNKALEKIKGLKALRKLDLRSTAVNSKGMVHLSGLGSLRSLDLSEAAVGDKGLEDLAKLENLEDLILWQTTATDAGMEHVGKLTKLRRLNLDKCKVGDNGLAHLKGLSELQYLHLGTTKVTDAGLPHLYELKNLQELVITFCPKVTPEGIKQLQDKLPGLTKVTR